MNAADGDSSQGLKDLLIDESSAAVASSAVLATKPRQPSADSQTVTTTMKNILATVGIHSDKPVDPGNIDSVLKNAIYPHPPPPPVQPHPGRIGHQQPIMLPFSDEEDYSSTDSLTGILTSHSNFTTFEADCAVATGKWMFEVTILDTGIQQIGWSRPGRRYTNENGVGDFKDSFAYDGVRQKRWNIGDRRYGHRWAVGDVITCCLDLGLGEMSFSRNGVSLGVAFRNVRLGTQFAYVPAVSLSRHESIQVNLGQTPLAYPVEGYWPIYVQQPSSMPTLLRLSQACCQTPAAAPQVKMAVLSCHSAALARITSELHVPLHRHELFAELLNMGHADEQGLRELLLQWQQLLSMAAMVSLSQAIMAQAVATLAHYLDWQPELAHALHVVTLVLQLLTPSQRATVLSSQNGQRRASGLFHRRAVGLDGLPDGSFPTFQPLPPDQMQSNNTDYFDQITILNQHITTTFQARASLLALLLQDCPPKACTDLLQDQGPSALAWLDQACRPTRSVLSQAPGTSAGCATGLFYALLDLVRTGIQTNSLQTPPTTPTTPLSDLGLGNVAPFLHRGEDRLGGLMSVVKKSYLTLVEQGQAAPLPTGLSKLMESIPALLLHFACRLLPRLRPGLKAMRDLNVDVTQALEATVSAHAQLQAHPDAEVLQKQVDLQVTQAKSLVATAQAMTLTALGTAGRVAWLTLLTQAARAILHHTEERTLGFVPCVLAEIVMEGMASLHSEPCLVADGNLHIPYLVRHGHQDALCLGAHALYTLLGSESVANPDLIANVVNHVRHVTTQPAYVQVIAHSPTVATTLVHGCLHSFKGNNWVSTAELIPRFFRQRNFGQDACIRTMLLPLRDVPFDCSSEGMQEVVRTASLDQPELTNTFLNHLLNHLNWTAAELSQVVDDIQAQQAAVVFNRDNEGRYRRGVLLFELEANLLRLLEAYVRVLPELFVGESVDPATNRVRVLEAVLHVLNRASLGAQHAFLESQLLLNACHRDVLLYACLGTLLTLVEHDASLVAEIGANPQLKSEHLEYLRSDDFAHLAVSQRISTSALDQIKALVTALEPHVTARQAEIRRLLERQQRGSANNDEDEEEEDNLCSICCATEKQCTFVPCQHRSCQMCINRHLKNSNKCFFCNAEIESVKEDSQQPMDQAEDAHEDGSKPTLGAKTSFV
eukprot:m.267664 g.267664  ORF g.267664 m.267664 type:complete len:1168 (-) comp17642_c0_seq2:1273-4776(-)